MSVRTNRPVLNVVLLSYGVESRLKNADNSCDGFSRAVTFAKKMCASISLSNWSKLGSRTSMSATWSAGRPMPNVPER